MKTNTEPKLHISLSKEHKKYQTDVTDAFKGFDTSFDNGLMRFSSAELPMQIILSFGGWVVSNIAWDLLKSSVSKIYKKFTQAKITVRDSDSIMFNIKPDLSVSVLVIPDRAKEFAHIKTVDDLIIYFKSKSKQSVDAGWQLVPVSDVFTFVKSYAFSRDNLTNGVLAGDKIGNIHYGDIHATYTSENIDLSKIQIPIVKDVAFNPKKEDLLKDGDLIMADASEDYDGIGVTISVHGIGKNKVVGGLHTFVLRDEKGLTSEYYRQYIFLNKEIRNELQKVANGVSVYGISKTALAKMELPLPSLSEQNRIVSVLETWDKSIEKLSTKIEMKRQIKLGLNQNILTGRKRLSGFKGPWKTFLLKEVSNIYDGTHQTPTYLEKGIPFYSVEHVTANNFQDTKYISEEVYETEIKKVRIEKGDILMTRIGSIGAIKYVDWDVKASFYVTLALLKVDKKFDPKALSFFLTTRSFQDELYGKTLHVAFPIKINLGDIGECKIYLPEDIREQKAIAEILTTADKEITELEKKLSILKEQKRYLLNNLITGTIRTPETLSTKLTK